MFKNNTGKVIKAGTLVISDGRGGVKPIYGRSLLDDDEIRKIWKERHDSFKGFKNAQRQIIIKRGKDESKN